LETAQTIAHTACPDLGLDQGRLAANGVNQTSARVNASGWLWSFAEGQLFRPTSLKADGPLSAHFSISGTGRYP
jgi:hypothetical protein